MHSMRALKSYKDVTKFLLYYLKARCHSLGRIVRKMKDGAVVMTCDFFHCPSGQFHHSYIFIVYFLFLAQI